MTFHLMLTSILPILLGIAILIQPKLLNYMVAIYLIAIGVINMNGFRI